MILITDTKDIKEKNLVATIGFFDGVHAGHRSLIGELKQEAARRNMASAVITFAVHPRMVLNTDYKPALLSSYSEKIALLDATGIDYCIVLDFTYELSCLSAKDFIEKVLYKEMNVRVLLIGYDHRFGHDRKDGFEQYVSYGKACGMDVLRASCLETPGEIVSSSVIRRLISCGKVAEAADFLTYYYSITGKVVEGHKLGRTIGFPTANILPDEPLKLIPSPGVYAVRLYMDNSYYNGMLYIGNRPTVNNGSDVSIEVNIFDFSGDLYGKTVTVSFISRTRDDIRFESIEELKAQLEKDKGECRKELRSQVVK